MILRKKIMPLVLFFVFLVAFVANAQTILTGRAVSLTDILSLSQDIGGFLIIAGTIIAGIAIIWSGIVYVTSGSDATRVKSAKDMLKAAIIGAFILALTGVIIKVIRGLAED